MLWSHSTMASSRRSSRRAASSSSKLDPITPSIRRGVESLVRGNESYAAKMLSVDMSGASSSSVPKIADAFVRCMAMNRLTAEMLLAQFFDASVLSVYSKSVLEKSGKGSAATLAARIAREWSKPDFCASNASPDDGGNVDRDDEGEEATAPSKRNREIEDDEGDARRRRPNRVKEIERTEEADD